MSPPIVHNLIIYFNQAEGEGLEPSRPLSPTGLANPPLHQLGYPSFFLWAGRDLNPRSREATDLQSARFDHLPTYPFKIYKSIFSAFCISLILQKLRITFLTIPELGWWSVCSYLYRMLESNQLPLPCLRERVLCLRRLAIYN